MAFRFSTNLSASAWASRSRGTFPTACYRDLQHFAVEFFSCGTPPKKECMSLFIRQEDQHREDRLLANAWSKDYIGRREKVASRQLVRPDSAHDANKKVAKAKWPKSGALLNGPHPKAGSAVTRRLPPQLVTNRERRNKSGPLAASVRVSVNLLVNRSCSPSRFAEAAGRRDGRLESLGHFQLRGVDEAKEIFGLRHSQTAGFATRRSLTK